MGRLLGQGATAPVFEATHAAFGVPIAIKVCLTADACRSEVHFLSKLKQHANSEDPHCACIPEVVRSGNLSFAMKPVAHSFFSNQSHSREILSGTVTFDARHARQLVNLLQCLHKKGVYHRDVRPPNIMVTADGSTAMLLDFDAAIQVRNSDKRVLYRGAFTHASRNVLQSLASSLPVTFTAADELESLVHSVFAFMSPHLMVKLSSQVNAHDTESVRAAHVCAFWQQEMVRFFSLLVVFYGQLIAYCSQSCTFWTESVRLATSVSYKELAAHFAHGLPEKREAL